MAPSPRIPGPLLLPPLSFLILSALRSVPRRGADRRYSRATTFTSGEQNTWSRRRGGTSARQQARTFQTVILLPTAQLRRSRGCRGWRSSNCSSRLSIATLLFVARAAFTSLTTCAVVQEYVSCPLAEFKSAATAFRSRIFALSRFVGPPPKSSASISRTFASAGLNVPSWNTAPRVVFALYGAGHSVKWFFQ